MATIENNSILNNLSLSAIASQYAQGISNHNSQQQIAQQYVQQMAMQQSQYIRQPSRADNGLVGRAAPAMSSGGYSMGSSLSPESILNTIKAGVYVSETDYSTMAAPSQPTVGMLVLDTKATDDIRNWWVQGSIGTFDNSRVEPAFSTTVANIPTKPEEVNPLKCFYAEDGKGLNWKAIYATVESNDCEHSVKLSIAEALIHAKECGFRESIKR
jgi:hypothetical protein